MKKIRLGLLFGGRSAEHEISILSARNIYNALDKNKYDITLIGIDQDGVWCLRDEAIFMLTSPNATLPALPRGKDELALVPTPENAGIVPLGKPDDMSTLDVVFPVLHGPFGEDGTVQGFLKLANIPYVGPDVLGSAICMDKDVMKRLLREAKIPIAKFLTVHAQNRNDFTFERVTQELGHTLFTKPANLGSSVGVNRVETKEQYDRAMDEAFLYDNKAMVEECIEGREMDCAVLGNENPIASGIGEVVITKSKHQFYSYDAKYIDDDGARTFQIADIPDDVRDRARDISLRAYRTLCCEGLARVDLFLRPNGEVLVNELNTIPGFTSISMYPKLWEAAGVSQRELCDKLIEHGIARFKRDSKLKTKK